MGLPKQGSSEPPSLSTNALRHNLKATSLSSNLLRFIFLTGKWQAISSTPRTKFGGLLPATGLYRSSRCDKGTYFTYPSCKTMELLEDTWGSLPSSKSSSYFIGRSDIWLKMQAQTLIFGLCRLLHWGHQTSKQLSHVWSWMEISIATAAPEYLVSPR